MKKFFSILMALLLTVAVSAQTVEYSRPLENTYVTLVGGGITTTHPGFKTQPFFWDGAKDVVMGVRPFAGVEVGKYVTPVVGFSVEGLAMFNTTATNTFVSQHNIVGNLKLNLSNWFGGYPGQPRKLEVVLVPGLGWGHDYGDVYNDRNYFTYNVGLEFNVNLGKERAWQLNIKPTVVSNNYNNVILPKPANLQGRLQVGITYKFGSKAKKSHNFVLCPYSVTAEDYELAQNRIKELESRKPQVDTVTVIKEVIVEKEVPVETKVNNVTVYFNKGSFELSERELSHLDFYAQNADKNAAIKITGSADSATGSPARNAYLAEQRALTVKKVLVEKYGFDESKISIDVVRDLFDVAVRSRVAVVE